MSGIRDIAGLADMELDEDAPEHAAATAATASDAAVNPPTTKREEAGRER
jgi:hypothetical protein